jgi:putative two-component system hydrogenase maturation factor HypX/HoxX
MSTWWRQTHHTWQDIAYHEEGHVGYVRFNFYSGAMATHHCQRLAQALRWVQARPVRVLVLLGGEEFWSNGIHLGCIEAVGLSGGSTADASWDNIQAMDDVAEAILANTNQLTVAAVAGNTGAGGCFLARAAGYLWLRKGVLLNPHYKNMGNLYGSEYWTYTLPSRVGEEQARRIMQDRLPMSAEAALACGFADACLDADRATFDGQVDAMAQQLAQEPGWSHTMQQRRAQRLRDEAHKPLAQYRDEELAHMRRNFFGFDTSYHIARHHFVRKSPASWTPRHLALHRHPGWVVSP